MQTTQENNAQPTDDVAGRIAHVSLLIREAMCAATPASPEQFLTLTVPGKFEPVNLMALADGFDDQGQRITSATDCYAQHQEAILCDQMPALSAIQSGPTHRSVARSYVATLDKFCPGSGPGVAEETPSNAERRYQYAMNWLTSLVPGDSGKTQVEMYGQKQEKYNEALQRKARAFEDAFKQATTEGSDSMKQRVIYEKWVSENQTTYENLVQAAYMEWVTIGRKAEVESYFSVVNIDSPMSRIEASKASMRNFVISTPDGAGECYKVYLTPANWAWLAKKKAGDLNDSLDDTSETLTMKIAHLEQINLLLESVREGSRSTNQKDDVVAPEDGNEREKGVAREYFEIEGRYRSACEEYGRAVEEGNSEEKIVQLKRNQDELKAVLNAMQARLSHCLKEIEKKSLNTLAHVARRARQEVFAYDGIYMQMSKNKAEIERLKDMREAFFVHGYDRGKAAAELQEEFIDRAGFPRALPLANSIWTSIRIRVGSVPDATGGSDFNFMRQMSNASVEISFDYMRVDIKRPWLHKELFFDQDLRVHQAEYVSPGPVKFAELADPNNPEISSTERELEMKRYELFPMYPTAFLVAANIVLEVAGETSEIQSYLNSPFASASVCYGPFSIGGRGAPATAGSNSTCKVTATGCKITIKSPQIIGWISDVLPALPRTI